MKGREISAASPEVAADGLLSRRIIEAMVREGLDVNSVVLALARFLAKTDAPELVRLAREELRGQRIPKLLTFRPPGSTPGA